MPYKYGLTEAEKEQIREQYRHNIETINSYFPEQYKDYRYKLDMAGLNKKLNDPSQVYIFKKSLEVNAREEKKKDIQERLEAELKDLKDPNKIYPLGRFLHTDLIPSDDPEAEAYNREKIRQYYLHPEAVVQKRFEKLFDMNLEEVAKMSKCKDLDALMIAWSDKNQTDIFDCFEAFGTVGKYPKDMLSPAMVKYATGVSRNYEPLMDANERLIHTRTGDLIAPHTMSEEQENILGGTAWEHEQADLANLIRQNSTGEATISYEERKQAFAKFFKGLEQKGIPVEGNGALTGYVVEHQDPKEKYASVSKWILGGTTGNTKLVRLTDQEKAEIKQFFAQDYTHEEGFHEPEIPAKFKPDPMEEAREKLVFKYAVKFDKSYVELDNGGFGKIAEAIKGGPVERLFRTTSKQYNNLTEAMKAYDNPNHVYYKDPKPMNMAANDYLVHKGVHNKEEAMRLPQPSRDRSLLCLDILEEFQKGVPEAERLSPGVAPKPVPRKNEELNAGSNLIQPAQEKKPWPPAIEDPSLVEDKDDLVKDEPKTINEKVEEMEKEKPDPTIVDPQ